MSIITVPPNQLGWNSINACTAVTVLMAVVVGLRFYARIYRKVDLGYDDWAVLITFILLLIMYIQMILWVFIGGQGYHIWELLEIDPSVPVVFGQIFYANEMTYSFASPAVKLSIILFYRRIFPVRYMRNLADITIVAIVFWILAMAIGSSTQCTPLAKAWDPEIPGTCFDTKKFVLALGGANIVFDVIILIMPIKPIWGLHRPWQDKVGLTIVFLVGGFVCFASMYRIATLLEIQLDDITYTTHEGAIWTYIEPCVGLIFGCLPVIRGLFPIYTPRRPNTCMNSRMRGPIFSFNTRNETYISGAPPNTTEERLHIPSEGSFEKLPIEGTDKILVHTTINIQR